MSNKELEAIEEVMLSEDIPEQPFLDMREIAHQIPVKERIAKFLEWRKR